MPQNRPCFVAAANPLRTTSTFRRSALRLAIATTRCLTSDRRDSSALARGGGSGAPAIGLSAHAPIVRGRLVIPAEQVQEAVGEKPRHLDHDLEPTLRRLPICSWDADDDVA